MPTTKSLFVVGIRILKLRIVHTRADPRLFSHAVRVMLQRHVHLLVAYKIGACSKSLTELGEAVRSIAPHAALGHVTHTSAI